MKKNINTKVCYVGQNKSDFISYPIREPVQFRESENHNILVNFVSNGCVLRPIICIIMNQDLVVQSKERKQSTEFCVDLVAAPLHFLLST